MKNAQPAMYINQDPHCNFCFYPILIFICTSMLRIWIVLGSVMLMAGCRSIYFGQTPVISTADKSKKPWLNIGSTNAQMLFYPKNVIFGAKADFRSATFNTLDAVSPDSVNAKSNFVDLSAFVGYNLQKNEEKNPVFVYGGIGRSISDYTENYKLRSTPFTAASVHFTGYGTHLFASIGPKIASKNKKNYFMPAFTGRLIYFSRADYISRGTMGGNPYVGNYLPEKNNLYQKVIPMYQASVTYMHQNNKILFFVNLNYNAGYSIYKSLTSRMGFGFRL